MVRCVLFSLDVNEFISLGHMRTYEDMMCPIWSLNVCCCYGSGFKKTENVLPLVKLSSTLWESARDDERGKKGGGRRASPWTKFFRKRECRNCLCKRVAASAAGKCFWRSVRPVRKSVHR